MNKLLQNDIFKFIVVGGISTTLDFLIYMVLSNYIYLSVAKTISIIIASIFSYLGNKFWTFEDSQKTSIKKMSKYCLVIVANITTNVYVNHSVYILLNNKIIAFILATIVATIVNYCLQKRFVFKKQRED